MNVLSSLFPTRNEAYLQYKNRTSPLVPLPATAVCQGSSSACAAVSSHCTTISTLRMKKLALKLVVMKEAMRMLRFSFKAGSIEGSNENV